MVEVRAQMGSRPVYLSFDIDALDPGFAPGTGTPEIAGLTPIQVYNQVSDATCTFSFSSSTGPDMDACALYRIMSNTFVVLVGLREWRLSAAAVV